MSAQSWNQYDLPPQMVAYEASNSHLNPNYFKPHKPSEPLPILPRGTEYAAMALEPNSWIDKTDAERRWLQYEYERDLRVPSWRRGKLKPEYFEATPSRPLLVPRRQDFRDYPHYVYAVRDFIMELHMLQKHAAENRKRDHPSWGESFKKFFKRMDFRGGMDKLSLAASLSMRPDVGLFLGLGGQIGEGLFSEDELKTIEKQMKKDSRAFDDLPINLFIDKRSGELVVKLRENVEHERLLTRVSQFEGAHGKVPSRFQQYKDDLDSLRHEVRMLRRANRREAAMDMTLDVVISLARRLVQLDGFARWTNQAGNWIAGNTLSPENRNYMNALMQSLMYARGDVETDVWMLLGQEMGIKEEELRKLSKTMPMRDAIIFLSKEARMDIDALQRKGRLPIDALKDADASFRKLSQEKLSQQSIDALQDAGFIPEGSVQGAISS